jgi:hypothetical protein
MDTTQPATPQEFAERWGVTDQALAADLARQVNAMSGRHGADAQAEQRHSLDGWAPPPPAPPPPQPTAVEMSQLALQHSEAQANDSFAQHHAPPQDPSGYEFPRAQHSLTDEDIALDNSIKTALHVEQIPAGLVRHALSDLNEAVHRQANETEVQRDARLDSTVSRLEEMWQKSGEGSFEENMAIIRQTLQGIKSPEIRRLVEINSSRFSPLIWDEILQFGKYRAARR